MPPSPEPPSDTASSEARSLVERLRAVLAEADRAGPAQREAVASCARDWLERGGVPSSPATGAGVGADAAPTDEVWHGIAGASPAMVALRDPIERFAAARAPVLVHGESGTGKELVARCLHDLGPRADAPFVAENCSAIPENLLESVLFGHVKGAFTGAVRDHPGHFVAADGGTLFLDEIGDMPSAMQAKLLRTLQEGEVRPVGGDKVRRVDVRVVAASHRDLERMVREGAFREDLFYRIAVLRIDLPPLRARDGDVVLLARRFLAEAASRSGRSLHLGDEALDALASFPWPGNVRQLQNEMQRVAALADGPVVGADDLSDEIRAGGRPAS